MNDLQLRERLERGIAAMGVGLSPEKVEALLAYLALLARWNRAYNLTAVDEPGEMVDRHLIDSLSILPWLKGNRVLDAGTGAGLPGVPLAIACPDRHFILVDSNGKKVRFLRQVRRDLRLANIEPVHGRLEMINPGEYPADDLVARALAPLPRLVGQLEGWLARGARLLAMKARLEHSECESVPSGYNVDRIELEVPGIAARRCLVIVSRHE